jgi:hypothetical protein
MDGMNNDFRTGINISLKSAPITMKQLQEHLAFKKRVLFLPATDHLLNAYVGPLEKPAIYNKQQDFLDQHTPRNNFELHPVLDVLRRVVMFPPILLLLPALLVIGVAGYHRLIDAILYWLERFSYRLFFAREEKIDTDLPAPLAPPPNSWIENIPRAMEEVQKNHYRIVLYGLESLTDEKRDKAREFMNRYPVLAVFADRTTSLKQFIDTENIDVLNSAAFCVSQEEVNVFMEAGFVRTDKEQRPSIIWLKNNPGDGSGADKDFIMNTSIDFSVACYLRRELRGFYGHYIAQSEVFYIGAENDGEIRQYFLRKLEELRVRFAEQGKTLHFLTADRTTGNHQVLEEAMGHLCFMVPSLRVLDKQQLVDEMGAAFASSPDHVVEQLLAYRLGLPEMPWPVLLRRYPDSKGAMGNIFTYMHLAQPCMTLDELLDFYFGQLGNTVANSIFYSLIPSSSEKKYSTDNDFYYATEAGQPGSEELEEAGVHAEELKAVFDKLDNEKSGRRAQLLGLMLQELANRLEEGHPGLAGEIKNALQRHLAKPRISRLIVTKDYKVLLSDYGMMEIPMYPLAKIVFILFLKYPDGIRFKEMSDHLPELERLYQDVTGRELDTRIRNSLIDLCDSSHQSLPQKIARIRGALCSLLPRSIADVYSIQGPNGAPKKIPLDRNLVEWQ